MGKVEAIKTEHSTDWHWEKFAEFVALKALVNEPSPHMQMIPGITKGRSLQDVIWFSGLYCAFYNLPSAMVMWEDWPWERVLKESDTIGDWLDTHWKGLATRVERRAVRTVANMNESVQSYIYWAERILPSYLAYPADPADNERDYDVIWQETDTKLRFMGRYIIIRLLEALHRFAGLKPHLYDIRSIGGWSPKRALGLLYPNELPLLLSPDTKENVAKVDALARSTIEKFARDFGVPMSEYVFAAMLCEYRVAYENRHQYPGWTIDQEPAYWYKIEDYWRGAKGDQWADAVQGKFYKARKDLFPQECLGEINGWPNTRVPPRSVLRDHGYNWSDLVYDYNATTDFANPVRR